MSAERQSHTPESSSEQSRAELEAMGREQMEHLSKSPEANPEHQAENAQEAREKIEQHTKEPEPSEEAKAPVSFVAKVNHVVNYSQTMQSLRSHLSPASRSFSKVIHSPAVEATSEALEKTVLRPSVTNGALWTTAIVGLFFYVVARHYGYAMSGSELLISLIAGGFIGFGLELVGRAMTRRER